MKKFLSVIGILIAITLLTATLLPKDFKITQSIVIDKPQAQVFDFVKIMKNGEQWQVRSPLDPVVDLFFDFIADSLYRSLRNLFE
jgi:uncharacterized protein involved in exopolysaccharide biosynthesis